VQKGPRDAGPFLLVVWSLLQNVQKDAWAAREFCSALADSVDKIVDFFPESCIKIPDSSLGNSYSILLEIASPYLSIRNT
jgi:hypothetical protein